MSNSAYTQSITELFAKLYKPRSEVVPFNRSDLETICQKYNVKNIGDVLYSFRSRQQLPSSIRRTAKRGFHWVIEFKGKGKYQFSQWPVAYIKPQILEPTLIKDCTPKMISQCLADDEQGMLTRMRHNNILRNFLDLDIYHLQSHLRTFVPGVGQVEIDDVYVGVDQQSKQFIIPIQAKSSHDLISATQCSQDILYCEYFHPNYKCRSVAIKSIGNETLAVFELKAKAPGHICIVNERHFQFI
jgi:hypothetical protein